MVPLSILDLAPIVEGGTAAEALRNTLDLARHADRWGYERYWLAEHHNMDGVASSATAVLIGYVAGGTERIRVGSGGVMLPNHAPLVVAEQFGTLATLYPGRIDLGIGRAPGTDPLAMRALRRHLAVAEEDFARDVQDVLGYLDPAWPGQRVRAIPGEGTRVPVWLLGSSLFSAQVAGMLGLPFAFASHFAPDLRLPALQAYRARFRPSPMLPAPHVMVGVNVVCADTAEEATYHATSLSLRFLAMHRGRRVPVPRPVATTDGLWTDAERLAVERMLTVSAVGEPDAVRRQLDDLVAATAADELIVACAVHDHQARLGTYERLARLAGR